MFFCALPGSIYLVLAAKFIQGKGGDVMKIAFVAIPVALFVVRWLVIQLSRKLATTHYDAHVLERLSHVRCVFAGGRASRALYLLIQKQIPCPQKAASIATA
jgi:hypothetical protein